MHRYMGRSSLRLHGFDYRSSAIYFVTICTTQKEHWFGEILDGKMIPNDTGKIAWKYWYEIPAHYPFVELDAFVVMPNHVHGLIRIDNDIGSHMPLADAGEIRSGMQLHATTTKNKRHFGKPVADSLSMMINTYKGAVTRELGRIQGNPIRLWQHNFHDHIVRDEKELWAVRQYIRDNPKNAAHDHM